MARELDPEQSHACWLAQVIVECADAAGIGVMVTVALPVLRNLYANNAAARILGRDVDELLRMDPLSMIAPGEVQRLGELAALFVSSGTAPDTLRLSATTVDGSKLTLDISLSPIQLDQGPAVVSFIVDVTSQQRAWESLDASEQRFRRVVESVREAIFITEGSTIRYANPAFAELLGLRSDDRVEGREIVTFTDLSNQARFQKHLASASFGRVEVERLQMTTCDDRIISVELSSIAMEYEEATVVLSFGHEVTEGEDMEQQLIQADRLAMLGTLAGGMAHAINNPLSYLILNVEHLTRHLPGLLTDREYLTEARVRLAEAHDGANRVAAVVKRMRAFSRMQKREPRRLNVNSVLEDALALVGNEIRHRGQLTTLLGNVPDVWGSEGQLEQAFLSLLVHATRSLPEGGAQQGLIHIEVHSGGDGNIWVSCRYDRREPETLSVRERHPDPQAAHGDGDGIGLAVCRDLVSGFGGQLFLESSGNHQEIVHIVLPPAAIEPEKEDPVSTEISEPFTGTPTPACVLVIDDDPGVASALRVMLQDQHDVTSVDSGRLGLQRLLEDDRFDVAFCDLVMPDMSGIDLYHALKLNRPGAEEKLVFMTGGVFTPEAEQFLAQVSNARVEKPFNLLQIHALLRQFARRPPD